MDLQSLRQGLLPKWIILTALVSIGNSIQAYSTLHFTQRVYEGSSTKLAKAPANASLAATSPVTPLSARTFGTWTFFAAVVRLYAALNINDPNLYQLAFAAYATAFLHFSSEWLIFGTTRWGKGLAGPIFVSTGSMLWMVMQWGYYVR